MPTTQIKIPEGAKNITINMNATNFGTVLEFDDPYTERHYWLKA